MIITTRQIVNITTITLYHYKMSSESIKIFYIIRVSCTKKNGRETYGVCGVARSENEAIEMCRIASQDAGEYGRVYVKVGQIGIFYDDLHDEDNILICYSKGEILED